MVSPGANRPRTYPAYLLLVHDGRPIVSGVSPVPSLAQLLFNSRINRRASIASPRPKAPLAVYAIRSLEDRRQGHWRIVLAHFMTYSFGAQGNAHRRLSALDKSQPGRPIWVCQDCVDFPVDDFAISQIFRSGPNVLYKERVPIVD